MSVETATAVARSIEVNASPERAFSVFTTQMETWWPPEHHIIAGTLAGMHVELVPGGRMYDVNTEGAECTWGRVLVCEPPRTFAFAWLIGPDWGVLHPDAPASRVTVTFTPLNDGRTQVDLVHDDLDKHGEGWEKMRDGVGAPEGWGMTLERFAAAVGS